ncbi:MAG: hypothetical protein SF097_03875 [Acidobacteriota bacterium]|nr:hypothetical protein [Acidobacteriota bacterium]
MPNNHEFYVGYLPKAPSGIAALAKRSVIGLVLLTMAVALVLVFGQQRFAVSFFEFGKVQEFQGVVREWPIPLLISGSTGKALVAEGKHGASSLVAGMEGHSVKLSGTLIYRDGLEMIEVIEGSVQFLGKADREVSTIEDLGTHSLAGEIVDSKCYLGVMNPGHTKPHRECASLCIRGGVPPMFVVRDAANRSVNLWLVSETGEPVNQQVLDFVAEPLEITGQVSRIGDQLYFRAAPATYKRLP